MEAERIHDTAELSNEEKIEELRGNVNYAIVVLAGGITEGYKQEAKIPPLPRLRLDAAIMEYNDVLALGYSPVLILSGGATLKNGTMTEAEQMRKDLREKHNMDDARILTENNSIDTVTNAEESKKILEELGFLERDEYGHLKEDKDGFPKIVTLVTSDFHLPRSKRLFERHLGRKITPLSAEKLLIRKGEEVFMQKAEKLIMEEQEENKEKMENLNKRGRNFALPGDTMEHPYARYSEMLLESKEYLLLRIKDIVIESVYSVPGAKALLLAIAEKSRR